MAKCTKSTSELLSRTLYRQREHGCGINSWVYRYENAAPITKAWVGCGLEIGVQLDGSWKLASRFGSERTYAPNQICRVSVGERYRLEYEGKSRPGLQVGFIVCDSALAGVDGELRFTGDSGMADRALTAFAWSFANDPTISDEQTVAAVKDFVSRHAELVPMSPLLACKRELERYFARDLGVDHLSAAGGLHPATFVRQFKTAYGLTPVAYRIMLRANFAARLLWSRPRWPIAKVAEECGFPNVSYFHRTFSRCFGMTPSTARSRFLPSEAA